MVRAIPTSPLMLIPLPLGSVGLSPSLLRGSSTLGESRRRRSINSLEEVLASDPDAAGATPDPSTSSGAHPAVGGGLLKQRTQVWTPDRRETREALSRALRASSDLQPQQYNPYTLAFTNSVREATYQDQAVNLHKKDTQVIYMACLFLLLGLGLLEYAEHYTADLRDDLCALYISSAAALVTLIALNVVRGFRVRFAGYSTITAALILCSTEVLTVRGMGQGRGKRKGYGRVKQRKGRVMYCEYGKYGKVWYNMGKGRVKYGIVWYSMV